MAIFFSLLAVLLVASGPAGAHYEIFSPLLGVGITAVGLGLLALLFLSSLLSLARRKGINWLAFLFGLAGVGALGALGYFSTLHPINDLTTDLKNPPKFLHPAFPMRVEKGGEYLDPALQIHRDYDASAGASQLTLYPDLEGISVKAPAKAVYAEALTAIRHHYPSWKVVLNDANSSHAEMEVESELFHFVDDVALEVRANPRSSFDSRLELRSRSRLGKSDLGANAKRLRELREVLEPALRPLEARFAQERLASEKASAASPVVEKK